MKSRYDDAMLENQRLQDRIDSMEFVRRNYSSSSRQHTNSSISGTNMYLPPTPPNRSARTPSVSRFASVERELEASIPPPYRSRESSVVRRTSRDYSSDRWSSRRDSITMGPYPDNEYITSNKQRPDRWSTTNAPKLSSPNNNSSSLPGSRNFSKEKLARNSSKEILFNIIHHYLNVSIALSSYEYGSLAKLNSFTILYH